MRPIPLFTEQGNVVMLSQTEEELRKAKVIISVNMQESLYAFCSQVVLDGDLSTWKIHDVETPRFHLAKYDVETGKIEPPADQDVNWLLAQVKDVNESWIQFIQFATSAKLPR